jgi:hypothetical protein
VTAVNLRMQGESDVQGPNKYLPLARKFIEEEIDNTRSWKGQYNKYKGLNTSTTR